MQANTRVISWLDQQLDHDLFLSAVTRGEIERGLNLMPRGKRRRAREAVAGAIFEAFEGRCLAYEENAAVAFGHIAASRMRQGRPISTEDAQIAAIALVHRMQLATRNTRDFEGIEALELVNPWER